MMYGAHPAIEGCMRLREALGVIVRARIPIGPDGRNRPSLFPFGTATGRNAQAKSLYNAHASMRSFMKFPPDKIGLYLDWRTQEVGIAAARSGDAQLAEDYLAGDIYHALAMMCGLTNDTDVKRWKASQKADPAAADEAAATRNQLRHGRDVAGARSRSASADRQRGHHPASATLSDSSGQWRADMVQRAMLERVIVSEFDGWPLHLSTSPNKRTLYNFPMQSGGAEMLRLAANRLCEADLVPSMLVHDGILLELDNEEQVEHAIEIMRAGRRRGLRRVRDRRRRRSEADRRRALSRQAAGGDQDVGNRDGDPAGDRRDRRCRLMGKRSNFETPREHFYPTPFEAVPPLIPYL